MKFIFQILFSIVVPVVGLTQEYEKMPLDVQNKMDENKILGKESLHGVYSYYSIRYTQKKQVDASEIVSLLVEDIHVVSCEVNEANHEIKLLTEAVYTIKDVKSKLIMMGVLIESFDINYSSIKQ